MASVSAICRTCLGQINHDDPKFNLDFIESTDSTSVRLKLCDLIPEMNLNITPNPVICFDCFSTIKVIQDFKKRCLKIEKRIQKCLQSSNSTSVDLNEVIKVKEQKHVAKKNKYKQKYDKVVEPPVTIQQLEMVDIESVVFNTDKHEFSAKDNSSQNGDYIKSEHLSTEMETQTNIKNEQISPSSKKKCNGLKKFSINLTDKPYKCKLCDHSSRTKGNLKMHMLTHSRKKRYKCAECKYRSAQKQHLVVHMRRHTGEKPYQCSECPYTCRQPTNLQNHMKYHHFSKYNI